MIVGAACVLGAALAAYYVPRSWVPHDAGSLAQSAERVARGELPHRDFDEIYTGGLSMLNALAFQVIGPSILTLRLVLFALFLAWLPAVSYLASRFVRPAAAALTVLVAVVWSVPNYFAAIPSWYNLFFATFGTAALMRYMETTRRRYLVLAGMAGGLSFLAKIAGLYFVAAGALFLLYREHCMARVGTENTRSRAYVVTVTTALAVVMLALVRTIGWRAGLQGVFMFLMPCGAVIVWLAWHMWSEPAGTNKERFARATRLLLPYAVGVLLPVVLFLVPYAASHALGAFWNGVFVLPPKRLEFASMGPPPLENLAWALVPALLLWRVDGWPGARRRWLLVASAVLLAWIFISGRNVRVYSQVWFATLPLIPLAVLAGFLMLSARHGAFTDERRQQLVLVLGVAAFASLVQFPFAAPIYFCYVAPLGVIAAVAVGAASGTGTRQLGTVLLVFYLLFGALWVNGGFVHLFGIPYRRDVPLEALRLSRAGISVTARDARVYETVVATVQAHARGDYIWAGPDAPEVYFLAEKRNPTRTLFDFFESPDGRTERLLAALERHQVNVVVVNSTPGFSGRLSSALEGELVRRFPHALDVEWLQVRWR
jgi:hypothetical protein